MSLLRPTEQPWVELFQIFVSQLLLCNVLLGLVSINKTELKVGVRAISTKKGKCTCVEVETEFVCRYCHLDYELTR